MDKETILLEQIKALEKLLGFKNEIINHLEQQLAAEKLKPSTPFIPFYTNPCFHEYNTWNFPRTCFKCGKYDITTTSGTISGSISFPSGESLVMDKLTTVADE